ncbi:MAG TPA: VanZ family protein [Polyangiales bacterium]|jgi:hypothetical protein|nr:VanZ family protein [Polyangiales bacterium]
MAPWFPLYLVLMLAATLTPLSFTPWPDSFLHGPVAQDLVANVLAFLPFGWALRERSRVRVLVLAFAFSSAVELTQCFCLRVPSVWDIATNTLGAVLGTWLPAWPRAAALNRTRLRALGASLLVGTLLTLAWVARLAPGLPASDFSNWRPYTLCLGVEEEGEPVWQGTLRELRLYDRAVDERDAHSAAGAVLALQFASTSRALVAEPGGGTRDLPLLPPSAAGFSASAAGLRMGHARWCLPDELAQRVLARVSRTNTLGAVLRLTPGSGNEKGRRRVVAMSAGFRQRDFAFGENEGAFYAQIRSPLADLDGKGPELRVTQPGRERTWLANASRDWISVWELGGSGRELYTPSLIFPLALGKHFVHLLALCIAAASLGCALLAPRRARLPALVLGALLALGGLWLTGIFAHQPLSAITTLLPTLAVLAACVPLVRSFPLR